MVVVVDVIHVLEWICLMWAREELFSSPGCFIFIFPLRLCICTALTFQRCWTNGSRKTSACVSVHMYFDFMVENERISLLWYKQYILKCWLCYVTLHYIMLRFRFSKAKYWYLPNWFKSSLFLLALEKAVWIYPIDFVSKQSCLHASTAVTFNLINMNKVFEQCRTSKKWGKSTMKA